MINSRKGLSVLMTWVLTIIGVFVIGTIYIIFSEPMQILHATFSLLVTGDSLDGINRAYSVWNYLPPVAMIGLIAGAIIRSGMKEETYNGL